MASFRTVEFSEMGAANAGLRFVTVKSAHLKGRGDITVWLPEGPGDFSSLPLAILLHGVYGSHWGWAFMGGAHRTAARLIDEGEIRPIAVAMPSDGLWGDGSAYTRHPDRDFERWIVDDVPAAVGQLLPQCELGPLFLSGLSMGGFGALRIAAKYGRDRFLAVSAHSSITDFEQMSLFVEEPLESYGVAAEDRSVLETVLANRGNLPAIRFDCGGSDLLIEQNRALHHGLIDAGIEHVYEEFEGGHEWGYWQEHVADTLRFFERVLRSGATQSN